MSHLMILQAHNVSIPEAKKKLEELEKTLEEQYHVTLQWVSETEAKVQRQGLSGTLKIELNQILVNLDLGFLLSIMKDKIEEVLQDELKKLFG